MMKNIIDILTMIDFILVGIFFTMVIILIGYISIDIIKREGKYIDNLDIELKEN